MKELIGMTGEGREAAVGQRRKPLSFFCRTTDTPDQINSRFLLRNPIFRDGLVFLLFSAHFGAAA